MPKAKWAILIKPKGVKTVDNHKKWVDAAAQLGCHAIRVNAGSQGSYEEQQKRAAEGLRMLCEYGDKANINILVENHGGFSSNMSAAYCRDEKWLIINGLEHCPTLETFRPATSP